MSLVDSLAGLITPQIVGSLASRLGESESAVSKGLTGGAATLLSGLAGRATDTSFLSTILSLVTGPGGGSSLLGSLAGLASGNANSAVTDIGGKLLSMLLGNNQGAIASAIASAAGLKSSSASGILSMAAPMVLGLLSQKVSSGGLNAAGLGSMLAGESASLKGLLPAGIGSLLSAGMPNVAAAARAAVPEVKAAGTNWLLPILLGLGLLGGLWWFMNRSAEPMKEASTEVATKAAEIAAPVVDAAKSMWASLGEFFKFKLPNGVEIDIPRLGVENKLIEFIGDASKAVDKTTWFDFDRLLFDTSKATLQPASQGQLVTTAAILKAFPNVHLKIGGYTDNTGDKAFNMKLSQDRANTVVAELVKLGVEPARLSGEGYGDAHPVGDNATEEGRAKNRRISMRVTKK